MKDKQPTAASLRVFISCVTREFEQDLHLDTDQNEARFPQFRSALAHYIRRFDCDAKVQEDFFQSGDVDTLEKIAVYIRACAAVVHLVGCETGDRPNDLCRRRFLNNKDLLGGKEFIQDHRDLQNALGDYSDLSYTQWEAFQALHFNIPLLIYATDDAADHQRDHLARLKLLNKRAETFETREELVGKLLADLKQYVVNIPELTSDFNYDRWLQEYANPAEIAGSIRGVRNLLAGLLLTACVIVFLLVGVISGLNRNNIQNDSVGKDTRSSNSVLLNAVASSDIDSLVGASEFDATLILQSCTSSGLRNIGNNPLLSDNDRWRFAQVFNSVVREHGNQGVQLTREQAKNLHRDDPSITMTAVASASENPLVQSLAREFRADDKILFFMIQDMIKDE